MYIKNLLDTGKLAKLIGFRGKSWVTWRLSPYILMYFMNHGNVLFTGPIDSRRKGGKKVKREKETKYYTRITEYPSS